MNSLNIHRVGAGVLVAFALIGCNSSSAGGGNSPPQLIDSGTDDGDGSVSMQDGAQADANVANLDHFSFFVTSEKGLKELSGSNLGFGGDLRYGETGAGAGLRGADKICAALAEKSMPGASAKQWRAFLSAASDENGQVVNAKDRIGQGPWYDRLGRLLSPTLAELTAGDRPAGGDATIKDDFPNEDGVPNHDPDGTGAVDNHDMLTGSNTSGGLYSTTATCLDWTAATGNQGVEGKPRVGHSWPRGGGGGGGGPGGGSMNNWMSSLTESGCAPGGSTVEMGAPNPAENTVGSGGGYGGFYCFALVP